MAKVDLDKLLNDLGVSGAAPGAQSPGASRTQFSQPSTTPAQASPSGPAIGESSERPAIPPPPGPAFDLASILAPGGPIKRSDDDDQPEPDAEQTPAPPVEADASSEQFNESLPPQDPDHVGVDPQAALMHIYAPDANAGPVDDAADPGLQLVQAGVMTQEQLDAARLAVDTTPGLRLGDAIVAQGVDEAKAFEAVAKAAGLEFERLDLSHGPDAAFDTTQAQNLTTEFCKENLVLPLRTERGRLVMGVARPDDVFTHDDVRGRLGANSLKLVVCMPSELLAALAMLDLGQMEEVDVDEILDAVEEDDVQVQKQDQNEVDLGREAAESPVIRYVNYIIQQAIKEGASDIHIEPGDKGLKVRFRIDGVLFEAMHPPMKMAAAITSRLKIMANLDISERRVPQDGRIRCSVQGRKLDLRMSTLPTTYGEKTVMRILDTRSISVGLDDLGFDENSLTIWKHQLDQPHGIMLVTGPTGSGKTTTLYSSLRQMDKVTQNISTVEDPVEYHLDGITQTQTHEKIGMTFAKALKALLRQDPDVIMIGEIRDMETALTAVQASLTGHLVLSTLHTNDAPSSITRLVNIGVEPFMIAAACNAALAQRLVRKICPHCKREAKLNDDMKEMLEMQGIQADTVLEGEGCDRCRKTGHTGRLGIYELLVIDDHLRDVIARSPNVTEFRRMCVERGMVTLRQDGFTKVKNGQTTIAEVLRVTESAI